VEEDSALAIKILLFGWRLTKEKCRQNRRPPGRRAAAAAVEANIRKAFSGELDTTALEAASEVDSIMSEQAVEEV
jgi:hypothetical protein